MDMDWTHAFVVDTNTYAGNFERELCAYITGEVGECGVGNEEAAIFRAEVLDDFDFRGLIEQPSDEDGCHRPCSTFETPGMVNDGHGNEFVLKDAPPTDKCYNKTYWPAYDSVAIYFRKRPDDETIALMKERAYKFFATDWKNTLNPAKDTVKISGFRWLTMKTTYASEEI